MRSTLRILHVAENDRRGGAARSAYRLHAGLRAGGDLSRMFVSRKLGDDEDVRALPEQRLDRPLRSGLEWLGVHDSISLASLAVAREPWFRECDVLQLHNLHSGRFSLAALPVLTRSRPAVWYFHDMWPLTGHVPFAEDCARWLTGCGSCPRVRDYPPLRRDTTRLLWRMKQTAYRRSAFTVVTPSRWLEGKVRSSPLFEGFDVRTVPYGVDGETFHPGPAEEARRELGLPSGRAVVLFSAAYVLERRKGYETLKRAWRRLSPRPLLVVAGRYAPEEPDENVRVFEDVVDERELARLYRAADVTVVASSEDNLPNVVLESMACGTPCVATATGGLAEAVRDGETGLLVPPGAVEALARALELVLDDRELRARLAAGALELARREYATPVYTRRFRDLYLELLWSWRAGSTRRTVASPSDSRVTA